MSALAPHWPTLLALSLLLVVGLAVLDDYGVTIDEVTHRETAAQNFRYLAGDADAFADHKRFYGIAFKGSLLIVERALGIEESRAVYLSRHLLTHLFFLTGGLFSYLLARRLFGSGPLALFAMLVFLLHPRLYGHSFVNYRDIPFLAMFAIALYLTHRAVRRDAVFAFILLGAGAGVLVNLRVAGLLLVAAIPAMRTLDFVFAQDWRRRKRIALTTGAFALTAALTFFALFPYLWGDPLGRIGEWWSLFENHPSYPLELFRGMLYPSVDFPDHYVPVWISIASPPFALLLGLIGVAVVLANSGKARVGALRNTRARFWTLLIGCLLLPILSVVLLDVNLYNGWRHLYFIWAPLSLFAALGLRALASAFGKERSRAMTYAAATVGVAATLASMVLLHPNEQAFFNFLADRAKPEHLRTQYPMDYWRNPMRQALEWLLDEHPFPSVNAHSLSEHRGGMIEENIAILPRKDRERLSTFPGLDAAVLVHENARPRFIYAYEGEPPAERVIHRIKVYNNTITTIQKKQDLRAAHERATQADPVIRSGFDLYLQEEAVVYVKEPCAETDDALFRRSEFTLQFIPTDARYLIHSDEQWRGFRQVQFTFPGYGAFFDGKCVASVPLPFPAAAIRASQHVHRRGFLWEAEYRVNPQAIREAYAQVRDKEPVARSAFDVHLTDDALVYVKEPCDSTHMRSPFFLHIFPRLLADLPRERRQYGFENRGFEVLILHGDLFDGKCVASVPLPEYPATGIRTGQFVRGEGEIWSAEFSTNPAVYQTAYRDVADDEPVARSAFDLYLADDALVYVKEPCDRTDTEPRFFLHLTPERADDLPEDRREHGFVNLDFAFFLSGAIFDGKCAARALLPNYSIANVRTGQTATDGGEIWRVEFPIRRPSPLP